MSNKKRIDLIQKQINELYFQINSIESSSIKNFKTKHINMLADINRITILYVRTINMEFNKGSVHV